MTLDLHPDIRIRKLTIGTEKAPLLVIDNLITDADELVRSAASKPFAQSTRHFPGIRARAPLSYQQLIAERLKTTLLEYFELEAGRSDSPCATTRW